jgi:hypothetical protein
MREKENKSGQGEKYEIDMRRLEEEIHVDKTIVL